MLRLPFLAAVLGSVALACGPGSASDFPATGALDAEIGAAVAAARAAVEQAPREGRAWLQAGMTFEGSDLPTQARACYGKALALDESPEGWYRSSVVARKLGDLEDAVRSIRRALELAPQYAPSHWRLGGYLFEQGDFEGAREAFRRATELDDRFVGAWAGLVRVHLSRGESSEALALLERLRTRFPGHTHLDNLMRTALVEAGRTLEAGRLPPPAKVPSSPGDDPWQLEFWRFQSRPLMARARQALESGAPEEAVPLLEEWLAGGTADPNASAYLAWGYCLLRRPLDARAALDAALAHDPDNVVVLDMLARIQEVSQELEPALATCRRIATVDPRNGANLAHCGRLLARLGRPEEALAALRSAVELDGRDPEVWAELGLVLAERQRWEEAVPALGRALEGGAAKPGTRTALARAYVETGRTSEARELLERSSALTPEEQALLARVKPQ